MPHPSSPTPQARIVFMGTPDFAVPSLDALVEAGLAPVAVVTVPDRRAGRGQTMRASAVKEAAQRHGIGVMQPESLKDEAFQHELAALRPDVIAVVAFRILPPAVYECARLGAFNLHGSLLPAYRGAAPIARALMDGVTETGVTTFLLKPSRRYRRRDPAARDARRARRDGGRRARPTGSDRRRGGRRDRAASRSRARRETEAQDDALASPAPKLFRDDARIDWSASAQDVHNHIRALSPFPGAWTEWPAGETFKVIQARIDADHQGAPGEVVESGPRLVVACGDGAVEVLEAQRQGKKRMRASEMLNGAAPEVSDLLG